MLADGKFWEDLQHAVNTGPLLGENLDCKHEQTEMGFSLFRLLFENASTARMYYFCNLKTFLGPSLMVQWLKLRASNAGGPGFNPWSGN